MQILIPSLFCLYLILDFGLGMNGSLAQAVGKNATLSDRTKIWAFLLSMHTNPVIGTGYQSFWLGWRLLYVWTESGLGHLNEAHNGYLEVYLEEGMVGVTVLAVFLGASYYGICKRLARSSSLAVLGEAALAGGKAKKAPVPAPALAGESANARATHARSMQWMAHGNPPEIGTRS